jgi:hypothetical protein
MTRRDFFGCLAGGLLAHPTPTISHTADPSRHRGGSFITWDAVIESTCGIPMTGITYNVYRGARRDGSDATRVNRRRIEQCRYFDIDVEPDAVCYYFVTAVSAAGVEGIRSRPLSDLRAPDLI